MNQLTQKLGTGEMVVQDIPYPQVLDGMIIVRNHFSIISSGTEGETVSAARKNLVSKAKSRPEQVKQVVETLKSQGPIQTFRAVSNKLDAYSPLGYSCSGEVIEVGNNVKEFKVGDFVACAGAGYASHSEIVSIPENLAVKLSNDANLKNSAYNTLGAIAMQSIRQSKLSLGESCVVIGLGLLGQITGLILKASGVKVIGVDVSDLAINFSKKNNSFDKVYLRNDNDIENKIKLDTNGIGADAIIISAASKSNDPINFAGKIARRKATVVILGDVPTGFDRNPYWYNKELELRMSCSYGPGRYDYNYEEKGVDYPVEYVRWTEKRNMEAFQDLLINKKINLDYLTTHEFDFDNAPKAFDLIMNKYEYFIGIILKYNIKNKINKGKIEVNPNKSTNKVNLSFIGAGNYAITHLLPNIPNNDLISRVGVLTKNGLTSKKVSEKFKFNFCTSDENDILNNETNTIFIATRHDSHASFIIKALKNNKNVFVEKPLCLKEEELDKICAIKKKSSGILMVGYNRRYAPLTSYIKKEIKGPCSMIYRINAGYITKDNWIHDFDIGGGRIVGEACHFIDYMIHLCGSTPIKVSANVLADKEGLNDSVNILLQFSNGSSGVISYLSNGSKKLSKEYIEVFYNQKVFILDDFKELKIFNNKKKIRKKLFVQNKGQKQMMSIFLDSILNTNASPIPFSQIVSSSKASFKVLESINKGKMLDID
ncbi:bi-domain-containing oxidoreductase [Candidatus Marinimicrobia bacterium]|nr:bi-domain-containing oxidoreductase [Candidatus Neomarinimicrobiota bacterium]